MSSYQLSATDRDLLRRLVADLAAIAAMPVQAERAALWTRLNDLQPVRPLIWITEIPWHELANEPELVLRCTSPWARRLELQWRQQLYQWRHFPGDMIIGEELGCGITYHSTGFGIHQNGELLPTPGGGVVSQHFVPQIREMADIAKIKDPVVSVDWSDTKARLNAMRAAFGDLMPVRLQGVNNVWYTPWDNLIRWYGVTEAMTDLIDRPELINAAVARTAEAAHRELDQMVALGLLAPNVENCRIGSGAYGYTSALHPSRRPGTPVTPDQLWGCSNAQIFSEVSPDMTWEFALRHDLPWLARWGMTYYGCCEPLHNKMGILRRVPNLRKISINYRAKVAVAAKELANQYVFSYKPNPAFLAEDTWRPAAVRAELSGLLTLTQGCQMEIVLKDISTLRYDPRRLWEWHTMAQEIVQTHPLA